MGFSPGYPEAGAKAHYQIRALPTATLKRCFPLLKQTAPTEMGILTFIV
jgi:hypothetical protein